MATFSFGGENMGDDFGGMAGFGASVEPKEAKIEWIRKDTPPDQDAWTLIPGIGWVNKDEVNIDILRRFPGLVLQEI